MIALENIVKPAELAAVWPAKYPAAGMRKRTKWELGEEGIITRARFRTSQLLNMQEGRRQGEGTNRIRKGGLAKFFPTPGGSHAHRADLCW